MQTIDIISIYGAIVATFSLLISAMLGYLRWKEKKPHIIAKIVDDYAESNKIVISATNDGLSIVTLEECKIKVLNQMDLKVKLVEDYKQFYQKGQFFSRSNLITGPYELLPGKRYDIAIFKNDIYLALIENNILHGKMKLLCYFRDLLENVYESKIYEFDIDEYSSTNLSGINHSDQ
ncbi:MAG: hypothetical protein ABR985_00355 [Methanotrichaceae archaeon]|jgi:hypothetical protein